MFQFGARQFARRTSIGLYSLAALGIFATAASATTLGIDYASSPSGALCNTTVCVYGFQFAVASGTSITVTALGAFDGPQGGSGNPGKVANLTNAVTVDLFNSSGTVIASDLVGGGNGGTQVGNWFAFNNITPVDLAAGTYMVTAAFSTGQVTAFPVPNPTVGSGISLSEFVSCTNQNPNPGVSSKNGVCTNPPNIGQFLTTTTNSQGSLGGNIQFTVDTNNTTAAAAVPEPGSLLLLGTGILGLARVARRRRS